ncbi:MAG TPA: hypothetical protein VGE36_14280 [Roseateles sp.]
MKTLLQGKAGQLEVAAGESPVVPGVVRIKAGPGLMFSVFLSHEEAAQLACTLAEAARVSAAASDAERGAWTCGKCGFRGFWSGGAHC